MFRDGDPCLAPWAPPLRRAITRDVGTILEYRRCLLLVTGDGKAKVVAQAAGGPITSMISATALQLHARATMSVDEAAAANLAEQDYQTWRRISLRIISQKITKGTKNFVVFAAFC